MNIAIGAGVVIILFICVYIKMSLDEKKGVNSEEKQRVKEIIAEQTGSNDYTALYATWESLAFSGGGRRVVETTSYWYYSVGFKKGELVIIPLSFEHGTMQYGTPTYYHKDNVYLVNTKPGKNWLELYDEQGNSLAAIIVAAIETKDDKFHPVNIVQKEEYQAFLEFAKEFMQEINDAHGVIATGKIGKFQ